LRKEPDSLPRRALSREERSLDWYLKEIGEVELLSRGEEAELARRIKDGDQEALQKLTKANLRFVVSVAKHYQNQGLSMGDLISEGNLGLMMAAKRFDETKGFKFISYAVWWIRQAILMALSEQPRVVRLPLNKIGELRKIGRAMKGLEQELGRKPSAGEIADEIEMSPYEVMNTFNVSRRYISLDAPRRRDDDEYSLLDVLEDQHQPPPDEVLMEESLKGEVERVLSTLKWREAKIVNLYFGINQEKSFTLDEIGEELGLTRERVRQIKEKALKRLRYISRGRLLKDYWDRMS